MVPRWPVRPPFLSSTHSVLTAVVASAAYLRQSIALTAYETPETRSLYNSFVNVAGKIRTEKAYAPIPVPEGVDQVCTTIFNGSPTLNDRFPTVTYLL